MNLLLVAILRLFGKILTKIVSKRFEKWLDYQRDRLVAENSLISPDIISGWVTDMLPNADPQHPWKKIRWKALYSINLHKKISRYDADNNMPDSVMEAIRLTGNTLSADMQKGWLGRHKVSRFINSTCSREIDLSIIRQTSTNATLSFSDPKSFVRENDTNESTCYRFNKGLMARIIFCEIVLYTISHLSSEGDPTNASKFIQILNKKQPHYFQNVCNDLLSINGLRKMSGAYQKFDFRNKNDLRSCQGEFDYLSRWSKTMKVVVVSDDVSVCEGHKEPFEEKKNNRNGALKTKVDEYDRYNDSYRHFLESAPEYGFDLYLAHYSNLHFDNGSLKEFEAWQINGEGWKEERIIPGFLYDKFPSDKNGREIKKSIEGDLNLHIWNKVSFTVQVADKKNIDDLLRTKGIETVGPTFKISSAPDVTADGLSRTQIVEQLKNSYKGLDWSDTTECLVIKPRDRFQGVGIERISPSKFLKFRPTEDMTNFGGGIVQPFYESIKPKVENIKGRHDIRVVVVGKEPVFVMLRELDADELDKVFVAARRNMKKNPAFRDIAWLGRHVDKIPGMVTATANVLRDEYGPHSIFSIDFMCDGGTNDPRIVEINTKPTQVWDPSYPGSEKSIKDFHNKILEEFGQLIE